MKKEIRNWKVFFEQAGIKDELIEEYIIYIQPLLKNKVPIIFDFNHLCLLLGKKHTFLASVVNSSENFYRCFEIPKRSGGVRKIEAPFHSLFECQSWIYNNILKNIKIHNKATGFTFKKSIITNAKIHVNQKDFLKIDIENFFSSITINQIIAIFKNLGYNNYVSFYLASICCKDGVLPQGAPTSPYLSNLASRNLDYRINLLSNHFSVNYSRYADDLAFSGDKIPYKFLSYVENIVRECGLELNKNKTFFQPHEKKGKRILTGISISGEVIKVPRAYKKDLIKTIYYIRKFGLISHISNEKIKNPHYIQTLIGKFYFWLSIEPQNSFVLNSITFLKKFTK